MTDPTDHPDPKEATEAKLCAYLEGELAPADRAEIERHLVSNPQHKQLLAELAKTREWMRSIPRVPAPSDLAESFQGQVERNMLLDESPINPAPRRWPQWWLAAAMVMLVLGLGALLTLMLSPASKPPVVVDKGYPGPAGKAVSAGDRTANPTTATNEPTVPVAPSPTPAPAPTVTPTPTPLPATPPTVAASPQPQPTGPIAGAVEPPVAKMAPTGDAATLAQGGRGPGLDAKNVTAADATKAVDRTEPIRDEASRQATPPWTPPVTGTLNIPADDHTIYVVVRTADPRATADLARAFFDREHLAKQSLEPAGGPALAMRNTVQNQAGYVQNAVPPNALQLSREQLRSRAADLMAETRPTTGPAGGDAGAVAAIAGQNLTRAQIDRLAASLAGAGTPGDVRIMVPDHGNYVDELSVTPIARGQSLLVIFADLDQKNIEKVNVVKVADDGTVVPPMITDSLTAAGVSPREFSRRLADRYRQENLSKVGKVDVTLIPAAPPVDKTIATTLPAATQPATAATAGYTAVVVTEPPQK